MATFTGFGGDTLGFLERLASNNNRDWFGEHKGEYEALVLEPALDFITAMGPVLANISDCFEAIPKRQGGSLMRVYRDTQLRTRQVASAAEKESKSDARRGDHDGMPCVPAKKFAAISSSPCTST